MTTMMKKTLRLRLPRRLRRGFTLAELGLSLIVVSILIQTGVQVASSYSARRATQSSAAYLTQVADQVGAYVEANFQSLRSDLASASGNTRERDWQTLIDANEISLAAPPRVPGGGDVRLFFTLGSSDTVYAVLVASNLRIRSLSPRPDPLVRLVGRVTPDDPDNIRGYEFSLEVPAIASIMGSDLVNAIAAVRSVSPITSVEPYLHRIEVPGRADLNRMAANLDMGGFNIVGAANVQATTATIQDRLQVTGTMDVDDIEVAGSARFGAVNVSGLTSASEVEVNNMTGNILTVDVVRADDGTFETVRAEEGVFDRLSAEDLDSDEFFSETANFVRINSGVVVADEVIANEIFIQD